MLPPSWTVRLVDRNAEELTDGRPRLGRPGDDRRHAGAAQRHRWKSSRIAQAHGKPVVVGGPAITSIPEGYPHADFQVLGEAEGVLDEFIEAWTNGVRKGVFKAEKFTADVTKSPIPRFDLLKFERLPARRRAVLARLSVHLRILRHHRAVRPRAAHQDDAADAGGTRPALPSSAIAATSISSTTISSATRRP